VYSVLLLLHSYMRWVVLVLALITVARALSGWRARRPWTATDEAASRWFVVAFDLQFTIGLLLYVAVSPLTRAALGNIGEAMQSSVLRFWAVEHVFGMVIALALAHIGRARASRERDSAGRHRLVFIWAGLALVAMLVSIPWPGMPAGRPLLRY
jgi:hypothetical protein